MKKRLLFPLILLLCISSAYGALVHGTVYDLDLSPAEAIVEVDTTPRQQQVAIGGRYSFDLQPGDYSITAKLIQHNETVASAEENISVADEGEFILDLILFPETGFDLDDIGTDLDEIIVKQKKDYTLLMIILVAAVIILIIGLNIVKYYVFKPKEKEDMEPTEARILELLKQNQGRMTQRDIRKEIPLSEAKISLVIADLESKDIVRKIKKGRSNIISLK